jgi:Ca2+-binding RTX toxin-like protein
MRAMKRAILITALLVCALTGGSAHATDPPWNVLLVGGSGSDSFQVKLSPDGRTYEIDSVAPLEVGGKVCWHPEGNPLQLLCDAPSIAGFEVRGEDGDDVVDVGSTVRVPVVLLGGAGNDRLVSGAGDDKLFGGDGFDRLNAEVGNDSALAGSGHDIIDGGLGNDKLGGEGGQDNMAGGPGDDQLSGGTRHDNLYGGAGNDRLNGGAGRDSLYGGVGDDRFLEALSDFVFGGPGRDVATPGGAVK